MVDPADLIRGKNLLKKLPTDNKGNYDWVESNISGNLLARTGRVGSTPTRATKVNV